MHTVQVGDVFRDTINGNVLTLDREIFYRKLFLFTTAKGNQVARGLKGLERIGHTIFIR